MIKEYYEDDREHVHVLSYGGGTQSTALLLMSLEGKVNGVVPDFIIFSDTGWEPSHVYDWVDKINNHIKNKYGREIIFTNGGNIKEDTLKGIKTGERFASMPFFTKDENGRKGMVMRQCTQEYKIAPINRKIKQILGYKPRERVREIVHIWKGISTDEIQRAKPIKLKWQVAEHPLIDVLNMDRSACVAYVERLGLGTPAQSSCIGCPFHSNGLWRDIKINDPESWNDAVEVDKKIRNQPRLESKAYLHKSAQPLEDVDLQEDQLDLNDFLNECEGVCGV
ncbi:MAG TPA: phosphoadenosine phosphosulfate reductase family protein [Massilibacterium sp.]|nr:phosphoadenosine phosphosulfate reductase family protein [Massilibacterium sp.]